jgi:carboxymethylenebutenolidase
MDRISDAQADYKSLVPDAPLSRRGFVVTSLATGFAAAAGPVAAQTVIKTDAAGLDAKEIKIPVAGGDMPGYVAMPAQGGPFPVVYVVHEVFSVHEHIKDLCRRLAKQGYLAISGDLFARHGDTSKYTMSEIPKLMSEVVSKVKYPELMADIDGAVAWAEKNKGDAGKLAITGFCWGGSVVWLYAAHQPKLKAGVAWYGHVIRQGWTRNPIDAAKELKAPVLGLYGGKDQGIPMDQVEMMQAELKKANSKSMIHVYPEAGHGFNADFRNSYREADAKDGWAKMLAWFKANGAA